VIVPRFYEYESETGSLDELAVMLGAAGAAVSAGLSCRGCDGAAVDQRERQ
jgi:hypothetical protein